MASYQQTIIIGNVGRSPQTKDVGGSTVCNFSVAVTDVWYDKNTNEKREKTTWFAVAAWGKLGEICSQYVVKGMQVMVTGDVDARAYLGNDGSAKAELRLTAREVKFLSGGQRQDDNDGYEEDTPF